MSILLCYIGGMIHGQSTKINMGTQLGVKKHYIFLGFAFIISFLFMAMRYDVGWDYMAYFDTITENQETNMLYSGELLNLMLIRIVQKIETPGLFFAIHAAIQHICIYRAISKYSINLWLSFVTFLFFPLFYINAFSIIRFFTALSITTAAFELIEKHELWKYILCIALACMFHKTAIICVLFYFFYDKKFDIIKIMALGLIGVVGLEILFYLVKRIMPTYMVYLNANANSEGIWWLVIFWGIGIAILICRKKIVRMNKVQELQCYIYFIGLWIYTLLFRYGTIGHRLSLYGTIYAILLLPQAISKINIKEKRVIEVVWVLMIAALFLLYIYMGRTTYIPYKTIFSI